VIQKSTGDTLALMYIAFNSPNMNNQQINDYLTRVIQPKLQTVPGVSQAQILGGQSFAMRVWLDPRRLASLGLNLQDVVNAINANNYQAAPGATKGTLVQYDVTVNTDLHSVQDFERMVISTNNGAVIRLSDVARIELGAESYDFSVKFDGKGAVFMGLFASPEANPLTVIKAVREELPQLEAQYPTGFVSNVVYDGTKYISDSIHEVIRTILEATGIVVLVIFLFLGSIRTVIIPVVAIPLSIIGTCALMLAMGYSINLLTLLAMVLSIGLVVDDAIVVVENVYRHLEEGLKPFDAAIKGAREIAVPVISMTITLAAVYAPIGFLGGLTGALFTEFAFTLAMTVILSGVIALTLSPMLSSKVMSESLMQNRFVHRVDVVFESIRRWYEKRLKNALLYRPVTLVFAVIVFASCIFMAMTSQKELAPEEDQGFIMTIVQAPTSANINYTELYTKELNPIYESIPEIDHYFVINGAMGVNGAFSGAVLKSFDERKRSQKVVQQVLQQKEGSIAGLQAFPIPLPSIPGTSSGGMPFQFIITTTKDYASLFEIAKAMEKKAQASGLFMFINSDLAFDKPNVELTIDRDKAANMGITMQSIASALANALGGNFVSRFSMSGQSYEVIPQFEQSDRLTPDLLKNIHVSDASGNMVSLGNFVSIKMISAPPALNQFQQLNSATLQGMTMPGHTIAEGLAYFQSLVPTMLPQGFSYDYGGELRQSVQEGNGLLYAFFFSLLIIYLVLAAQFESFTDPLIILISVPMSLCGALLFVNLGLSTLNIYSGIGLVTLIGLISKHGILMVEFANNLQRSQKLSIREAIIQSASIRLRPILMTTTAMVLGVLPLLMAKGPGAVSRFDVGLVIASGMLIGTCFTLFVVPTVYTFLARDHRNELS
jgi:multidrug efflux pump